MHLREQEGAEMPPAPLPDGLHYCRFCGGVVGRHGDIKSTCLCEGIACRYCGIGRVRRPTSDHYVPASGRFMHSPYFTGMGGCRDCVTRAAPERRRTLVGTGVRLRPEDGGQLQACVTAFPLKAPTRTMRTESASANRRRHSPAKSISCPTTSRRMRVSELRSG
jgi:hypothetical protein